MNTEPSIGVSSSKSVFLIVILYLVSFSKTKDTKWSFVNSADLYVPSVVNINWSFASFVTLNFLTSSSNINGFSTLNCVNSYSYPAYRFLDNALPFLTTNIFWSRILSFSYCNIQ